MAVILSGCGVRFVRPSKPDKFWEIEMFAVVKSGGKQYRVREGQELVVDRLEGEVGDTVELPVGFSVDEGGFDLAEKRARVEILDHLRGEKIYVYKYKPKKDYRKKTGHRQELTLVKVLEVSDGS
jgi:large subunit ribosomal protein L21